MKHKLIFIIAAAVLVLAIAGLLSWIFFVRGSSEKTSSGDTSFMQTLTGAKSDPLIKHLGVELAPYDPVKKSVGDIVFTNIPLEFNRLFFDFGFKIPDNSAGTAKTNPQPTFIVPLGTKVHAIVDGVVVGIPKLYSNDYSIHIAASKNSNRIYEMEHVINPVVKEGDTVKAGDVVAEVSDYDTRNTPGFGLVEIGILEGGNPPKHVCPFEYLDPAFKDEVSTNLNSLYTAWNEYIGKTIYTPSTYALPGCITTEKVEG